MIYILTAVCVFMWFFMLYLWSENSNLHSLVLQLDRREKNTRRQLRELEEDYEDHVHDFENY